MATPQNRTPRDLETRVLAERPKQWMPPEALPEPDKQAGFAYRWIRYRDWETDRKSTRLNSSHRL